MRASETLMAFSSKGRTSAGASQQNDTKGLNGVWCVACRAKKRCGACAACVCVCVVLCPVSNVMLRCVLCCVLCLLLLCVGACCALAVVSGMV